MFDLSVDLSVDLSRLALFVSASAMLVITPGPDILYVLTRGMTQGRKVGLAAALGFSVGVIVHTFFAMVGISALLQSSAVAFHIVKYAGAAYLIYLGVNAVRDRSRFALNTPDTADTPDTEPHTALQPIFWQSLVANVLNPKVIIFFLAFLPQFVDVSRGAVALQMLVLGGIFMLLTLGIFSSVAYASGYVGDHLLRHPSLADKLRWVTGGVLILLGLGLGFSRQH